MLDRRKRYKALLNRDMNTKGSDCASYPQVNSVFGFKNFLKDNSSLKSATPSIINGYVADLGSSLSGGYCSGGFFCPTGGEGGLARF